MYDGSIGFKSKWGSGSTFGFKVGVLLGDELQKMTLKEGSGSNLNTLEDLDGLE
jgi:hypothetical protein